MNSSTSYKRPKPKHQKFHFFSTCSPTMLFDGLSIDLDLTLDSEKCEDYLKTQIKSQVKDIEKYDLLIYLPGGIPFIRNKLSIVFSQDSQPSVKNYIYGVLTVPISYTNLEKKYTELCNVSSPLMKQLFSPLFESTLNGLCEISCLLEYFKQNLAFSQKFQKIASSFIPFPPFSTSFRRLIENKEVSGRDIVTITSTLYTYFNHLLGMKTPPDKIFEYSLKICNRIIEESEPFDLPIGYVELSIQMFWPSTVYQDFDHKLEFWKGDLIDSNDDFYYKLNFNVDEIGDKNKFTILKGNDDHYYLCIKKYIYTIVDPVTGEKEDYKDLREISSSRKFNDINVLYESDQIKQIVFICFEKSLAYSISACQYLTCFVQNMFEYNPSCLEGVITFSDSAEIDIPLTIPFADFDKFIHLESDRKRKNHIWDAISFACDELLKSENFKNAVKQIIVFSSGIKDSGSKMNLKELSVKMLKSKVVIDSFIINDYSISKELVTLSHITSGYSFNLKEKDLECLDLLDNSALYKYDRRKPNGCALIKGDRKTSRRHLKPVMLTDEFIQNATITAEFDKEIVDILHDKIIKEINFSTPRHSCYVNKNTQISNSRKKRILRELHYAAEIMNKNSSLYDPDIIILPSHSMIEIWNVFLKGIEGTPYENKWFNLYVTFPDNYPVDAPMIKFIHVPYHLNISYDGRVCFDYNNDRVVDIICDLKIIFLFPNIDCPLRIDASGLYEYDRSRYFNLAMKSAASVGKNDYHDFLNEPDNVDDFVDNDLEQEYISDPPPPYMLSQICGKKIKHPIKASTGVFYEKDELIQLISSSPNPICVVTGKPLTEKLEDLINMI